MSEKDLAGQLIERWKEEGGRRNMLEERTGGVEFEVFLEVGMAEVALDGWLYVSYESIVPSAWGFYLVIIDVDDDVVTSISHDRFVLVFHPVADLQ